MVRYFKIQNWQSNIPTLLESNKMLPDAYNILVSLILRIHEMDTQPIIFACPFRFGYKNALGLGEASSFLMLKLILKKSVFFRTFVLT